MKSPIQDGSSFKSAQVLKQLIPKKSIVGSYLLYSGALELSLSSADRFVIAHTTRGVVYEFWKCLETDAEYVAKQSKYFFDNLFQGAGELFSVESTFEHLQEMWATRPDPYVRASYFFLLNRCSSNGLVSSGKLDLRHMSPHAFSSLKNVHLKNFHSHFDKADDFIDTINKEDESKYLLFPVGRYSQNLLRSSKIVGPEDTAVRHQKLHDYLKECDKKWIVLYKKHRAVFQLYRGYNTTMVDKYGRKTLKTDDCEDIIIANF